MLYTLYIMSKYSRNSFTPALQNQNHRMQRWILGRLSHQVPMQDSDWTMQFFCRNRQRQMFFSCRTDSRGRTAFPIGLHGRRGSACCAKSKDTSHAPERHARPVLYSILYPFDHINVASQAQASSLGR